MVRGRGMVERSERENHVDWLERAIRSREQRIAELSNELRETLQKLEAAYASTSWRVTAPLRLLSRRSPRLARGLKRVAQVAHWTLTLRLRTHIRAGRARGRTESAADDSAGTGAYARWIELYDTLSPADDAAMRSMADVLADGPLVSVVMPVFDPPERFLREAIESVRAQAYENWELCIADDASRTPHVRALLEHYARHDERIRVVYRSTNGGISTASNSALALASGDLVAFLDHDDVLRPHALLLAVGAFTSRPGVGYVYCDEDQIDEAGRRYGHNFKPDWDPTLLLSQNYLCHFAVVRADLVRAVGGLRSEYDRSQDWDFALRVTALLPQEGVVHIPHVLYHWRAIAGSAALDIAEKPYAIDAGRRAVRDHVRRSGRACYVLPVGLHQSVRFAPPDPPPHVTVVVPSTGEPDVLGPCLAGLARTDYPSFDVLVALDGTAAGARSSRALLEAAERHLRVRPSIHDGGEFNFAWTVNWAASHAEGEFLLFLNDDVEPAANDWLETMVGHVLDDGVAVAGAMLLYPDETIQHAGMLLGGGDAVHLYRGRPARTAGYINRARLPREASAVTGACMLVRRDVFDALGGMDEKLGGAYNDVDFCLRVRRAGWRVVFVADAVLYHRESASFGSLVEGREREFADERSWMQRRWGPELDEDPFHNPNLAVDASYPSRLAFPPRIAYPWRRFSFQAASGRDERASSDTEGRRVPWTTLPARRRGVA